MYLIFNNNNNIKGNKNKQLKIGMINESIILLKNQYFNESKSFSKHSIWIFS